MITFGVLNPSCISAVFISVNLELIEAMAEAAVNLVVEHLIPFLIEEAKLLKGVRGEVEFIKDEMDSIRVLLKDADARAEIDEDVKVWVKQLRHVAFRMEDVLDEFRLRVMQQKETLHSGVAGWVRKSFGCVKQLKPRHKVASEIQDIKGKLIQISERKERYQFNRLDPAESAKAGSSSYRLSNGQRNYREDDALYAEESELVGIEEHRDQLIRWLVEGEERRSVFAVVGTGGVGKTTLVRKAYESAQVRSRFSCHAWITVSQSFQVEELLVKLIKQFHESTKEPISPPLDDKLERTQLIDKLRSYLQEKRYLVILDDVWSVELWTSLKNALLYNCCGSRIMVTTRTNDVASSFVKSSSQIYQLFPLPMKDALFLFCKISFGLDQCPTDLKDLPEKIVKRSGGLPLAIVAMGGLLLTKETTFLEWKKFHDTLSSNLGEDPNLKSVMKIISLSYQDLPYYLKSCFLCFGFFPEDYEITSFDLINLWIAEGFVKERRGRTLEEVAEDYLNQLISRNLVHANELHIYSNTYLNTKDCKVHDLMREFILSRSLEEGFCEVREGQSIASSLENTRRLSIQNVTSGEIVTKSMNSPSSLIRSLFVFQLDTLPNSLIQTFLSSFVLLKILILENTPLEDFPLEITNLVQLRLLDLSGTNIKVLPDSIANLKNLETLQLEFTCVVELPLAILKLQKLRHLLAIPRQNPYGVKIPERIGLLTALQTLVWIDGNQVTDLVTELGKLTQLRILGIGNLRRESGVNFGASIAKMHSLRNLYVGSRERDEIIDLQFASSPPLLLQGLFMDGRLEKLPDWIVLIENLNMLHLAFSKLREDPLKVLQGLPNLTAVELFDNAYDGEELHFQAESFPKLRSLILSNLDRLHAVIVHKGAVPILQQMSITRCEKLKAVPAGVEDLTKLKSLIFSDMPNDFTRRLAVGSEDYYKIQHVPVVRYD